MEPLYKYERVILVDDNYIDNIIHQKIILSTQFAKEVSIFESASLALNFLNQIKFDGKQPLVIFLDIRMPEMDGYGFLSELRNLQNISITQLKIYVLSSSLDPSDRKKIEKNPFAETFISKPLTAQILKQL